MSQIPFRGPPRELGRRCGARRRGTVLVNVERETTERHGSGMKNKTRVRNRTKMRKTKIGRREEEDEEKKTKEKEQEDA